MRTSNPVLCLALAGLACLPAPAAHAGSKGHFRLGQGFYQLLNGVYQIDEIKIDGCYGVIYMPEFVCRPEKSLDMKGVIGRYVLALLDPPDRVGGIRWMGFPLHKETESLVPMAGMAFMGPIITGGVVASDVAGPADLAGKIELKPRENGSRKRYGKLKYVVTNIDTAWLRYGKDLPRVDDLPCVFDPDGGQTDPAADDGSSASPPGEGWDIALGPKLEEKSNPGMLPSRVAFVRKKDNGWTFWFKGDTQPHPCEVDKGRERVVILCKYVDQDKDRSYVFIRFSGNVGEDGEIRGSTYQHFAAITVEEFKSQRARVAISGYWNAERHKASGP